MSSSSYLHDRTAVRSGAGTPQVPWTAVRSGAGTPQVPWTAVRSGAEMGLPSLRLSVPGCVIRRLSACTRVPHREG